MVGLLAGVGPVSSLWTAGSWGGWGSGVQRPRTHIPEAKTSSQARPRHGPLRTTRYVAMPVRLPRAGALSPLPTAPFPTRRLSLPTLPGLRMLPAHHIARLAPLPPAGTPPFPRSRLAPSFRSCHIPHPLPCLCCPSRCPRARLAAPFTFSSGPESLEVALFRPEDIPWDTLAFSSVAVSLRLYCEDMAAGAREVVSVVRTYKHVSVPGLVCKGYARLCGCISESPLRPSTPAFPLDSAPAFPRPLPCSLGRLAHCKAPTLHGQCATRQATQQCPRLNLGTPTPATLAKTSLLHTGLASLIPGAGERSRVHHRVTASYVCRNAPTTQLTQTFFVRSPPAPCRRPLPCAPRRDRQAAGQRAR